MKSKPFYFTINPSEFLADRLVDSMTATELGAVIRLLCRQWIDGDLPDDKEFLQRLSRLNTDDFNSSWRSIDLFFPVIGNGKRVNRYMAQEREKIVDSMRLKSSKGLKASAKRWGNSTPNNVFDVEIDGSPMPDPMGNPMPNHKNVNKNDAQPNGLPNAIYIDKDITKAKFIPKTKISLSLSKKTANLPMTIAQHKVFNFIWDTWPERSDKAFAKGERHLAEKSFRSLINDYGYNPYGLWLCADLYKNYPKVKEGYVKQISSFFDDENGLYIEFMRQIVEELGLDDQAILERFNEAYNTNLAISKIKESFKKHLEA